MLNNQGDKLGNKQDLKQEKRDLSIETGRASGQADEGEDWRPKASVAALKARAELLKEIRDFFYERDVLEVETPLIGHAAGTNPYIQVIPALLSMPQSQEASFYLQTSPEFAMKRLLASGLESIFQICKAFRNGELGKKHNPEFTMLEWYRLKFDHHQLMDEMDALLSRVLKTASADRLSYQDLFQQYLKIDPHQATTETLEDCARQQGIELHNTDSLNKTNWLTILFTHCIEPHLGKTVPMMIYDYPIEEAALAKIRPGTDGKPKVAERFEVYFRGVELANGFHELGDGQEQLARFQADNQERLRLNLPLVPIDMRMIAALNHGFPNCSGVAMGVDRLLMIKLNCKNIEDVLSFTIDNA